MREHLVIIIGKDKVEPKLYTCYVFEKSKEEAVQAAKNQYETKYKTKNYESYHFIH